MKKIPCILFLFLLFISLESLALEAALSHTNSCIIFEPKTPSEQKFKNIFSIIQTKSEEEALELIRKKKKNFRKIADSAFATTILCCASHHGKLRLVLELLCKFNVPCNKNTPVGTPLVCAVASGQLKVAQQLLRRPECRDVINNTYNPFNLPALGIAAARNALDIAKLLIDGGASVQQAGKNGIIPLCAAAINNHEEMGQELLQQGATTRTEYLDDAEQCPLYWTTHHKNARFTRLLLQYGSSAKTRFRVIDKESNTQCEKTALHNAIEQQDIETCSVLLEYHADVDAPDSNGQTPLHKAIVLNNKALVQLLWPHSKQQVVALHTAVQEFRTDIARFILEQNVNPNEAHEGYFPLHRVFTDHVDASAAIAQQQVDMAQLLLQHNADVNVVDQHGNMPLHDAALSKNFLAVQLLCARGAHVCTPDAKVGHPIHAATWAGSIEIVDCFLQHGASIHEQTPQKLTPILIAAASGNAPLVRYLCTQGADCTTVDENGESPLTLACENLDEQSLQYMMSHASTSEVRDFMYTTYMARHNIQELSPTTSIPQKSIHPTKKAAAIPISCNTDIKQTALPVEIIPPTQALPRDEFDNTWNHVVSQPIIHKSRFNRTFETSLWFINPEQAFQHGVIGGKYKLDEREKVIRHHQIPLIVDQLLMPQDEYDNDIVVNFEIRQKGKKTEIGSLSYAFNAEGICYHRCFSSRSRKKKPITTPRRIDALQDIKGYTITQDEKATYIIDNAQPTITYIMYHPME